MSYFPFFANIEALQGVIIGGGHVALEKVERLLSFNAKLTLVAKEISDDIKKYDSRITLVEAEYDSRYLNLADYVIAATDVTELNERIYADAKARKLLINVVDVPDKCDFIFPSVLQKGRLVVGVSTSGAGPQVGIRLRNEIERVIPDNIEEILDILAKERIEAKERIPDPVERRSYLIGLANKLLDEK